MANILVYSASEDSKQDELASKYIEPYELGVTPNPQDFITYNEETDEYDFKIVAKYPHVYSRSGVQSIVTYKVTDTQEAFIISMPNAIEILAECDNNPDSDYDWKDPEPTHVAKFRSVVGQTFFTGVGVEGDENYEAPRKKLAVLA